PEHNQRLNFVFESGLLDLAENSLDRARAQLQQVLAKYQNTNRRLADQVVALAGLAQCALKSGDMSLTAQLAAQASTPARRTAGSEQLSYGAGVALLTQVDVEQALGHAGRVRELAAQALAQLTPTVGTDHPLTKKAAALTKS